MDKKITLQRLGVILAYPLAYLYLRLLITFSEEFYIPVTIGYGEFKYNIAYPIFALIFCPV